MDDFFKFAEKYSDEQRPEDIFEERIRRRAERRHRLTVAALSMAAVTTAAVIISIAFLALSADKKSASIEDEKLKVASVSSGKEVAAGKSNDSKKEAENVVDVESPKIRKAINILIVGVDGPKGSKAARGLLVAKIDLIDGSVQAINIPDKTYLNIAGLGLDQISASYNNGLDSTKKAIHELLQVEPDNHIVVNIEDFQYMINGNKIQVAFDKASESSLDVEQRVEYVKELSSLDASKTSVVSLPVKLVTIGGEPYYQPNNEEISRLVESMWGIKIETRAEITRVMVINGSGQPGAGRSVIEKLKPGGFMVVDVKNASTPNYRNTTIVAYKEEYMDTARRAQGILGVGEVVYHPVAQDVAEIAVIIGRDYQILN